MEVGQGLFSAASDYARGDISGALRTVTGFVRAATTIATTGKTAQTRARQTKTSPADVVRTCLFLYFR